MKRFFNQQRTIRLIFAAWILVFIGTFFIGEKKDESVNVPLGVEQAAIVTYRGPTVAVTPYKWGVAVNLRIARVMEQAGARIYDVRYIVNRGGTFDLKDYLTAEDGGKLDGLPSFKFSGDPKLSKHLDTRIQETEEIAVEVGGHYYATLAVLFAVWIVWLLLLICYGRKKAPLPATPPLPEPTLAEMLRAFLAQLDTMDSTAKAKMEMLLIRRWQESAATGDVSMSAAFGAISRNEKTSSAMRQLQHWLHNPASTVRREEIAAVIEEASRI